MRKSLILFCAALSCAALFAACAPNGPAPGVPAGPLESHTPVVPPTATPDSDPAFGDAAAFGGCFLRNDCDWSDVEYGQLVDRFYVMPIVETVWEYSWDDISKIKADDLLLTCYKSNFINWEKDGEGVFLLKAAPADLVEWSIQEHFDVESDYLRTSSYYNPQDNTYTLIGGFGGGFSSATIRGERRGNRLTVEIGILSDFTERELLPGETLVKTEGYADRILTPKGTLTMERVYGKKVKYVSYKLFD